MVYWMLKEAEMFWYTKEKFRNMKRRWIFLIFLSVSKYFYVSKTLWLWLRPLYIVFGTWFSTAWSVEVQNTAIDQWDCWMWISVNRGLNSYQPPPPAVKKLKHFSKAQQGKFLSLPWRLVTGQIHTFKSINVCEWSWLVLLFTLEISSSNFVYVLPVYALPHRASLRVLDHN